MASKVARSDENMQRIWDNTIQNVERDIK
jgi:hypothetical protein